MNAQLQKLIDKRIAGEITEEQFFRQSFGLSISGSEKHEAISGLENAKHCDSIRYLLKTNGYKVASVHPVIDDTSDPSVGFKIVLQDQDLGRILRDYAYSVSVI